MGFTEVKRILSKKSRKNFFYNENLKEDVFIYKYPKLGKKLIINNLLSFNKAFIVINITQEKPNFLINKLIETYNIKDSYIFIMNIDIVRNSVYEDMNNLINKQYEDTNNNQINILNYWLDINDEKLHFVSPYIKIYLKSQYISYETMSHLKRRGDPIEQLNVDNKKFIHSRIEGIDKIVRYLFKINV